MALISGGSSAPSGAAGGDLTGTYPSPTFDLTKAHVYTGNQTAPALVASGLTGSVAASRYVGGVATVAPTTGTFAVGDFVIAQNAGLFVCTVAGTPGTWVAVGGSQPHTHEVFYTAANIADGVQAPLSWSPSSGPDSLLDISVPTLPTVKTTGIYAFTLAVEADNFTVGGYFDAALDLDLAGEDYGYVVVSNLKTAATAPTTLMAATMYLVAGMQIRVQATNRDGVATRPFNLAALVQRVG